MTPSEVEDFFGPKIDAEPVKPIFEVKADQPIWFELKGGQYTPVYDDDKNISNCSLSL